MELSMYSTSRDQRIGDLVDKDIITIDESALISDSVRIMKNNGLSSIFITRSGNKNASTQTKRFINSTIFGKQVQETGHIFFIDETKILHNYMLIVLFLIVGIHTVITNFYVSIFSSKLVRPLFYSSR